MSQKNPKRKITFIGAGSTVFAKNLLGDILSFPELADSSICLYDIDRERLATSERVAHRIGNALGIKAAIESTTDMGQALDGAAYAISMIQVGGYQPCTVTAFEVPKRFGSSSDDRGYFGNRRDHARPADGFPSAGTFSSNGTALPACRAS